MRTLATLILAIVLAGCATPAERAAQVEREVERMIQIYGPGCEKLGYKKDTDAWRDCILNLSVKDDYARYYSRYPTTAQCFGHRGFFHCSAF